MTNPALPNAARAPPQRCTADGRQLLIRYVTAHPHGKPPLRVDPCRRAATPQGWVRPSQASPGSEWIVP